MDNPSMGITDSTVDIDYATTLVDSVGSLPPILIGNKMNVIDGGHRLYAMKQSGMNYVPVIMSKI